MYSTTSSVFFWRKVCYHWWRYTQVRISQTSLPR